MEDNPVLLVDDSKEDLFMMRYAFRRAGVRNRVIEVQSGRQAIDYLNGVGAYEDRRRYPLPCIIITDLKMPEVDGFAFLAWLQGRDEFARVPRIVVSASSDEGDRRRAVRLGSCAYFVKPGDLDELVRVVKHMNSSWIAEHCPLPGAGAPTD